MVLEQEVLVTSISIALQPVCSVVILQCATKTILVVPVPVYFFGLDGLGISFEGLALS